MSQLTLSIPGPDLAAMPMDSDAFTVLRMLENHRGIDVPQSWEALLHRYHSAYDDMESRTSWGRSRLSNALDVAEAHGLIEYREAWRITRAGADARRAETVRRMRG